MFLDSLCIADLDGIPSCVEVVLVRPKLGFDADDHRVQDDHSAEHRVKLQEQLVLHRPTARFRLKKRLLGGQQPKFHNV